MYHFQIFSYVGTLILRTYTNPSARGIFNFLEKFLIAESLGNIYTSLVI